MGGLESGLGRSGEESEEKVSHPREVSRRETMLISHVFENKCTRCRLRYRISVSRCWEFCSEMDESRNYRGNFARSRAIGKWPSDESEKNEERSESEYDKRTKPV